MTLRRGPDFDKMPRCLHVVASLRLVSNQIPERRMERRMERRTACGDSDRIGGRGCDIVFCPLREAQSLVVSTFRRNSGNRKTGRDPGSKD